MTGAGLGPLMIDVEGIELTVADRTRLEHSSVGGVVLFQRNYTGQAQLAALIAEIKALRTPELLVATDHEGGRVQRFLEGFTRLPAPRVIGQMFSQDTARAMDDAKTLGRVMGVELQNVGIDLNFAPVLDLFHPGSRVIGDRAFHERPEIVARLAAQLVEGMQESGVHGVAKHFPGHGGVLDDSHHCLPVDGRPLAKISESDLEPYRQMDLDTLGGIMTCHILFPAVDQLPATFSRRWINDHLREELGFTGAVFSDDVIMKGAKGIGTPLARTLQAIDAGCDMVLVCNDPNSVDTILAAAPTPKDRDSEQRLKKLYGFRGLPALEASELESWAGRLEALSTRPKGP